jgi:hypothetical protein
MENGAAHFVCKLSGTIDLKLMSLQEFAITIVKTLI